MAEPVAAPSLPPIRVGPGGGSSSLRRRRRTIAIGPSVESLSYSVDMNRVALRAMREEASAPRRLYGYSGRTVVKLLTTVGTGIIIGLTAVALSQSIESSVLLRDHWSEAVMQAWYDPAHPVLSTLPALGLQLAIGVGAAVAAAALVQLVAPKAAGAGVTLVMAYLNGNDIPDALTFRTYAVKFLGNVAARFAGLALGPEGPMIHLGACVASCLCAAEDRLWNGGAEATTMSSNPAAESRTTLRHVTSVDARAAAAAAAAAAPAPPNEMLSSGEVLLPVSSTSPLPPPATEAVGLPPTSPPRPRLLAKKPHQVTPPFFSNADHREIVSAGAAAGLAAAFGAPIGGVLFSLEEACSHWSRNIGWRCFLAATAASFTLSQLHPRGKSGILGFGDILAPDNRQWLLQLPFITAVSILGGLLGAAFNTARGALAGWRYKPRRGNTPGRLVESAAVAAITTVAIFAASVRFGSCLTVPEVWEPELVLQFNCPRGQYNDMATLMLSTSVSVIRHLLGLGSEGQPVAPTCGLGHACYFSLKTLAIGTVLYLVLMILAASTASPGGLFMPSIMVGAQFGALSGLALHALLPPSFGIKPGILAIVCATATLGGVFRSSISLVVIVVEGTHGIDFMFGIIVAVVTSNAISQLLHRDGVYEGDLERDGTVFYLRQEAPHPLRFKTAADIMASPPLGLNSVAPVSRVLDLLRSTTHSAFIVYDDSSGRNPPLGRGRLAGLILRSQLMVLLRYGVYCDSRGRYLDPPADIDSLERWLVAEMAARQAPHRSSNKLVQGGRPGATHIVPRHVSQQMQDHPLVAAASTTGEEAEQASTLPWRRTRSDVNHAGREHQGVASGNQDSSVRFAVRPGALLAGQRLVTSNNNGGATNVLTRPQPLNGHQPNLDLNLLETPLPSMIMEESDARALLDVYAALQDQEGGSGAGPPPTTGEEPPTPFALGPEQEGGGAGDGSTTPRPSDNVSTTTFAPSPALARVSITLSPVHQEPLSDRSPPGSNSTESAAPLPKTPEVSPPRSPPRQTRELSSGELARLLEVQSSAGSGTPRPPLPPPDAYLNLEPFMACAPLAVRTATPAAEVHRLFLAMSLRHLPVVDRFGIVWGMITRKDLDRAAGRGWWRVSDAPPTPELASPLRASANVNPSRSSHHLASDDMERESSWRRAPRWLLAALQEQTSFLRYRQQHDGSRSGRTSAFDPSVTEPLLSDPENPGDNHHVP